MKIIFIWNETMNNFHKSFVLNKRSLFRYGENGFELHCLVVKINDFMFKYNLNWINYLKNFYNFLSCSNSFKRNFGHTLSFLFLFINIAWICNDFLNRGFSVIEHMLINCKFGQRSGIGNYFMQLLKKLSSVSIDFLYGVKSWLSCFGGSESEFRVLIKIF